MPMNFAWFIRLRGEDNMVDLIDNLLGIEEKERDTFLVEKEV